eukprot:6482405-Amphidinium_carterae.1
MTMRCGTLLRLTLKRGPNRLQLVHGEVKFGVLPIGDREAPGRPTPFAEWTRRCQTKICMLVFVMRSSGLQKPARKDAEGGILSSNKVVALGEVADVASLSTECLTQVLLSSDDEDDSIWESLEPHSAPKLVQSVDSPQKKNKNGSSTWKWRSTWKRLSKTLRDTRRLDPTGSAEARTPCWIGRYPVQPPRYRRSEGM